MMQELIIFLTYFIILFLFQFVSLVPVAEVAPYTWQICLKAKIMVLSRSFKMFQSKYFFDTNIPSILYQHI